MSKAKDTETINEIVTTLAVELIRKSGACEWEEPEVVRKIGQTAKALAKLIYFKELPNGD